MAKVKRVILDCDGVLANFVGAWCRLAAVLMAQKDFSTISIKLPTQFPAEHTEVPTWEMSHWPGWKGCDSFIGYVWDYIIEKHNEELEVPFFSTLEVTEFAGYDTSVLERYGHLCELVFATTRPNCAGPGPTTAAVTAAWIKDRFGVDNANVVRCDTISQKLELIKVLRPDFVLEDNPVALRTLKTLDNAGVFAPVVPYTDFYPYRVETLTHFFEVAIRKEVI